MTSKIPAYSANVGLEGIARLEPQTPALPSRGESGLTGDQVPQRIEKLFDSASLEQTMHAFVRPQPSDPGVLLPARFEALVRDSAREMLRQAKNNDHTALQKAGALLEHEVSLRDLLASYRTALMRA